MKRRHPSLLLLIALSFLLLFPTAPLSGAGESDPARRLWMGGYEALSQAEKAMEGQAQLAALHDYEKALEIFLKVQKQYPGWNTSLLAYRVDYCQKKIAEIKQSNKDNMAFLTKEELFTQLTTQANDLQALTEKLRAATQEQESLRRSLEKARGEAAAQAANEENLRILRKDRDTLAAQLRETTAQLTALQEEQRKNLQKSGNAEEQLREATEQLKRSQAGLATANRNLEQIAANRDELLQQTQRDSLWRKKAEEELAELRRVAENARSQQETAELQFQQLQVTLRQLETENASLRGTGASGAEADSVQKLQAKNRNLEQQLQSANMELLNTQRKLTLAEDSVTRLDDELKNERARQENQNTLMAAQIDRANAWEQERKELQDQTARLQQTVEAQKALLAALEEKNSHEKETLAKTAEELTQTQNELKARQNEVGTLRQSQAIANAADGIARIARENQQQLEELQKHDTALQSRHDALSEQLSQETARRKNAEGKLENLMENQTDAAAKIWQDRAAELQKELENAQKRQQDLESALLRREQEKQTLEKALAEKLPAEESTDSGAAVSSTTLSEQSVAALENGRLSATDQVIVKGFLKQGVEAEKSGKTEAAQWNYSQALSIQPDNFLALKRMGLISSAMGNDGDAAKYLSLAAKCTPDDCEVLLALGFAQLQLKQPQWALATLSRAAALRPDDPQTIRLFGVALGAMEWREAASLQLKKALALNDRDSEAAFNLAMIGLTRSSEIELQSRKDSRHREALERLASSLRQESLEWYRKAVANGAQEDPTLEKALQR